MGLFSTLLGGLEASDTQHAALFSEVGTLVNQSGGVGGLAQQFQQQGLGGLMSSWIGSGPNGAISGQQVVQVLGQDRVAAIAARAGLSEQQVAAGISMLLPLVINHLTPNGTTPAHSPGQVDAALGDLKNKLATAPPPAT
ncbi:MAG: YidB family protein [Verrucomicrobiota bacterium]